MKVIKKDGREEIFDRKKIANAVFQAALRADADSPLELSQKISNGQYGSHKEITVDEIHNLVENKLMDADKEVAKEYILYRNNRTRIREQKSELMDAIEEISKEVGKDNANVGNSAASKQYQIAETANKKYIISRLLKPEQAEAHKKGLVYINDLSYYQHTINCFFNPIGKMLKDGFDNGIGSIRSPKRIQSAMALVAIILQSSQNELYGGQGIIQFDTDLVSYVEAEYEYWLKHCKKFMPMCQEMIAKNLTEEAVYQACEAFVYNMNTMRSRSGAQPTFSSVNFGTDTSEYGRMISRNLLKAFMAGLGNGENPVFPNLCFRVKSGVNLEPGTPNYDLFQLALECVGKRIQPRFVFADAPVNIDSWETSAAMGCRTRIASNINGDKSPDARGNLAFNTISLPYLALEFAEKQKDNPCVIYTEFLKELDKTCDLAIDQLYERYQVMKRLKAKDLPFVSRWYMDGNLGDNDCIEPMIKNGSLSMGFLGLSECLKVLFGEHHGESNASQEHGLGIVKFMRKKTDEATQKYGLNFSLFASPAESACHTLLKLARKRFGIIEGVTDKEYFTNSFHLPVDFTCDIQTKIDIEAPYHQYCNAGAIMYAELNHSPKFNIQGLEQVVKYMATSGAVYGGINWVHKFCNKCKYQGDFDNECPNCGSDDVKITAIITGYLSTENKFNPGKVAELKARVSHGGGSLG